MTTKGLTKKVIRDAAFARRLELACDGAPLCPPLHKGRLTWIKNELFSKFSETASVETVRKWLSGETKPRPDKTAMLAELLMVDVSWLQLGIDQDLAPRERRLRNAVADGIVNVITGYIQMDGGHPAFPDESAAEQNVDIHAIIKGGKYDIHVSLADSSGTFFIPTNHEALIILGVVRHGFSIAVYEITAETIESEGVRQGGSISVAVPLKKLRQIETFSQRI